MSKNIVLLSDGTGNSSSSPYKTNVWRIYKAINTTSSKKKQLVFYDNGVGTSEFILTKLLGLAFGLGLKTNVKDLYRNLCRVYKHGDKVFIFGYSRGAFTARILAALIGNQGIIKEYESEQDLDKKVEEAYDSFRHENFVPSLLSFPRWIYHWLTYPQHPDSRNSKKRFFYQDNNEPLVECLGVWDTVDAYGAPIDELSRGWDVIVLPLTAKDRDLSPAVCNAYHALALDEQRESFEPMLWNEAADDGKARQSNVEQVWFAGVHSNIGGGNPDDSLAYVSLNWMIANCEKHHLELYTSLKKEFRNSANVNGPLYENRSGFGNVYRFAPRKLEVLCCSSKPGLWNSILLLFNSDKATKNEVNVDKPKIHHTVFTRIRDGGHGYAPINLPRIYSVVDDNGNVVEQPSDDESKPFIETQKHAASRRILQAEVWNKVWGLKILYFLLIFSGLLFVAGPYILGNQYEKSNSPVVESGDIIFGSIGDLFRLIPQYVGKIPGLEFIGGWASQYEKFPYSFVGGLAILAALIVAGQFVNASLKSQMRSYWSHITGEGNLWVEKNITKGAIANFLDSYRVSDSDENKIETSLADHGAALLRMGLELIAILLFLLAVLWIIWKIFFTIYDGTGYVCPKAADSGKAQQTLDDGDISSVDFKSNVECYDTLINLKKGTKYQISFSVPNTWKDGTIAADVHGWLESPGWYEPLLTPFRRHISKEWYQPIGRIGNAWYDRYTAASSVDLSRSERPVEYCMSFSIRPRQSGRLYIYLNDGVAPWPFDWQHFYKNNCMENNNGSLVGSCVGTFSIVKTPEREEKLTCSKAQLLGHGPDNKN